MAPDSATDEIVFGPFRLDLRRMALFRGEEPVEIQARPLEVLAYLSRRPGQVVDKQEILTGVWRDTHVSRTTLRVCIRNIRDALGESADAPRFIETVGRSGYRFGGLLGTRGELRATPEVRASLRSLLVGRGEDLRQLEECLDAARTGHRQIVFVAGPAGVGKTSVLRRFVETARQDGMLRAAEGQCTEQQSEAEPFGPVLEALSRLCRSNGEVIPILRRHAPCWLAQLPGTLDEEAMASVERRAAASTTARMLREIAEALEAMTVTRPLVLVLEDVHWSDASTLDLLAHVGQRPEAARLCIVATYRPSDSTARGHPLRRVVRDLVARGRAREIALDLLARTWIEGYLAKVFGGDASLDDLAEFVHERSQGNPLFMVEIVDHLLRRGWITRNARGWCIEDETVDVVPDSLRLLIERQLEVLDDDGRAILECASAAGGAFATASLASALGRASDEIEDRCEELASLGMFVEEVGAEEWPDGTISGRYRFVHVLHRNVLYDRIGETRRIRLHKALAERLESGFAERSTAIAGILARHYEVAREHERAVHHYHAAGVSALARDAYREACTSFERGLLCLENQPPSPRRDEVELELRFRYGVSLSLGKGFADPVIERTFSRYAELCSSLNPSLKRFAMLPLRGYNFVRGNMAEAERIADEYDGYAATSADGLSLSWSHFGAGENAFHRGKLGDARASFEAVLPHADHDLYRPGGLLRGTQDPAVSSRINLAVTLWLLGDLGLAEEQLREGMRLALDSGDPTTLVFAHTISAQYHYLRGDPAECARQADATLAIGGEHSFVYWFAYAGTYRAWAGLHLGEPDADTRLAEALAQYDRTGARIVRQLTLAFLAEAHSLGERVEAGIDCANQALADAAENGTPWADPILLRLRGEIEAAGGCREEATGSFREALRVAENQRSYSLALRAALCLHRLHADVASLQVLRSLLECFPSSARSPELVEARDLLE